MTQQRGKPDGRTLLGAGKLDDLVVRAFQHDVDLVIFDQELSPVQARNLTERLDLRVIDRTQLILDIFAQHASTRDGKLQVELAQLRYLMPRLAQQADRSLSRLAGGTARAGPARRSSRWTAAACATASRASSASSPRCGASASRAAAGARAGSFRCSRSSATRTRARAPCCAR